ncbi:MAG: LD-carboxypeptidase [Caldilineaceae bacterium]
MGRRWLGDHSVAAIERYHQSGVYIPAEDRAADLVTAPEYDVVWAFRGYSAVQLVPYLLEMQTANRPLLIGYSDITKASTPAGTRSGCQ